MADRLFALLALLLAALLPGHCHDSLLPGECSQAPSTDELKTFCYDEVEACDEDPRCRALMDSPEDVEPFPPPPESFQAVMDCFARTDDLKQAGWKPSRKKATPPPPPPPPPTRKKQPHIPAKSGEQLGCLPSGLWIQTDRFLSVQLYAKRSWTFSATRAFLLWRTYGLCYCIKLTQRMERNR